LTDLKNVKFNVIAWNIQNLIYIYAKLYRTYISKKRHTVNINRIRGCKILSYFELLLHLLMKSGI